MQIEGVGEQIKVCFKAFWHKGPGVNKEGQTHTQADRSSLESDYKLKCQTERHLQAQQNSFVAEFTLLYPPSSISLDSALG